MYLYEMHQHTAACSACSAADPEQVVRALAADGFSGMVLTEHFYHGNTAVRRDRPWERFVRAYEDSFLRMKAIGDRLGLDVLFGIEEGVGSGKEVLLYGIRPQLLYDHPELADEVTEDEYLPLLSSVVHEAGGLVFQAHPFRVRDYIPRPWETLPPQLLDGAETYNACNSTVENARAVQFAGQHGLRQSAGSDAHTAHFAGRFGIAVPHRLRDEAALAETLRAGDYTLHLGGKQD